MSRPTKIVTVALNPAVDRVIEVPGLRLGGHQRGRLISRTPAGKAVNVARALSALDVPTVVTGFVGEDCFDEYEAFLATGSVRSQLLAVAGRTRENITLVDPTAGVETHIRDAGFTIEASDFDRMKKKLNLLAGPDSLMIFSGSTPPGVTAALFRELIEIVLAKRAVVAVDTSDAALAAVAELPLWLVKPNVEELAALAGHAIDSDGEILRAGRALSKTIHTVVVSCGAAGGYVFVDGSALVGQVDLAGQKPVNTVGCGDCMLAGFVAAHLHGADVREAYRQALAVATAAAVSVNPGEFDPAAVERFARSASVESVTNTP